MNKRIEGAQRWLRQAQEDLAAARDVHEGGRHNGSCFMAQQGAEKALKAVYLGRGEPVEWVRSCLALDKAYIPARYPNGVPHGIPSDFFTAKDSQECLRHAEAIVSRCSRLLPST